MRLRKLLGVAVAVFIAALTLPTSPADAHDSHGWVYIGTDQVYNWDHRSESAEWSNKDWPVHIVFWNNANVGKVKGTDGTHSLDNDIFQTQGGAKYLRFNNSGGANNPSNQTFTWDSDAGRKRYNCVSNSNAWTEHFRVYGDLADHLWNPYWGYFVPVTTHWDFDDPEVPFTSCDNAQHGWDENAADWVAVLLPGSPLGSPLG